MSEISRIPSIVFKNTLLDNPSAQYPKFLREAKQIAFRLMQEHTDYPAGLMFLVIPLAEYNLIPQVTVLGVIQPPRIPIWPAPLGPAATPAQLEDFRQAASHCTKHWLVIEYFRTAIFTAMGEDLLQEIADPLAGEAVTMETLQVFQHLAATYGVLTSADVRELKLELEQPIVSDDMKTFVKFAANFSTIVLRLQTAGQALPAFEQMELFTTSTQHEPNIAKAIEKYVDNNPVLAARTLPQMITAVRTSLSNIAPAPMKSAYAGATNTTDRLSTPELLQKFADIESRLAAAMQQKSVSVPAGGKAGGAQSRNFVAGYCYLHGKCGHSGSQCRIMLADRAKFSNAMLKAKTPTDVAGGSTKG